MLENSAAPEFHILVSVRLPFLHHCIKSENRVSQIYDESSRHQGYNVPVVPLHAQAGLLSVNMYPSDWKFRSEADSDLGGLEWDLRVHIPHKLPGRPTLGYTDHIQ